MPGAGGGHVSVGDSGAPRNAAALTQGFSSSLLSHPTRCPSLGQPSPGCRCSRARSAGAVGTPSCCRPPPPSPPPGPSQQYQLQRRAVQRPCTTAPAAGGQPALLCLARVPTATFWRLRAPAPRQHPVLIGAPRESLALFIPPFLHDSTSSELTAGARGSLPWWGGGETGLLP